MPDLLIFIREAGSPEFYIKYPYFQMLAQKTFFLNITAAPVAFHRVQARDRERRVEVKHRPTAVSSTRADAMHV